MLRARTDEAKELRRRALLDAALAEFFERGFSAARMDDIAARAKLSKGTLYLYFDSKEALFTSLVETFAIPNIVMFEAAVQNAGSGVAAIRTFMKIAPSVIRESPLPKIAKILIADAPAFPEIVTAYREQVIERALGVIVSALRAAKEAGEIEIGDPRLTARLVIAPVLMSAIWRIVFEHDPAAKIDLDALFAEHEKMLLRGLGVKELAHA